MGKKGEAVTALVVIGLLALGAYTLMTVSSDSPTGLSTFETEAITSCSNVAVSDTLTQNINSTGSCINITADNVVLDCNGYVISFGTSFGSALHGVFAGNKSNITIKNCIINGSGSTNAGRGIDFSNVSNSTIFNNTIYTLGTSSENSIRCVNCQNINISNNWLSANGTSFFTAAEPVLLTNGNNFTFDNNILQSLNFASHGLLHISGAGNVTGNNNIFNVSATSASTAGVRVTNTGGVFNNSLYTAPNGSDLFLTQSGSSANTTFYNLNVTRQYGSVFFPNNLTFIDSNSPPLTEITVNQNYIFSGSSYSQFINSPSQMTLTSVPFSNPTITYSPPNDYVEVPCPSANCTFVSFSAPRIVFNVTRNGIAYSTSEIDNNATSSVTLTGNITTNATAYFINASNAFFDCAGYTVFYDRLGQSKSAILVNSVDNFTVRNCKFVDINSTGGATAVLLYNTDDTVVRNNSFIFNGSGYGFYYTYTNNHLIVNNTFSDSLFEGTAVYSTANNTNVSENFVHGGYYPFQFSGGTSYTRFINNTLNFSGAGLTITGSNNYAVNNTFNSTPPSGAGSTGISTSSDSNSIYENNVIFVDTDAGSGAGLNVDGTNLSIKHNTADIVDNNGGTLLTAAGSSHIIENNSLNSVVNSASGSGISISASNSIIRNNSVAVNGSWSTYGISISGADNFVTLNNFVVNITSSGAGVSISSTGNNVTNNSFDVVSGSSNINGAYISSATGNTLENNTIIFRGTEQDTGVKLESAGQNRILSNTILMNMSLGNNSGIHLAGSYGSQSDANNISHNNISINGTSQNYGVFLQLFADANRIFNNTILTNGSSSINYGIYLVAANDTFSGGGSSSLGTEGSSGGFTSSSVSNNNISNNIVFTGGTSQNDGIVLKATVGTGGGSTSGFSSSALNDENITITGNLVASNYIIAGGSSNNSGIYLWGLSVSLNSTNNSVIDNDIQTIGTGSFGLSLRSTNGSNITGNILNNSVQWIRIYNSNASFFDTTFKTTMGHIVFENSFEIANSSEYELTRDFINVSSNVAFVNSSAAPMLNQSAAIRFTGLSGSDHSPTVDFDDDGSFVACSGPQCTNIVYAGGILTFDVASFTSYSSLDASGVGVNLSKSDSQDPVNNGSQLNYTIIFNVTNGTAVNITITEVYPANVSFVSASPSPNVSNNTWQPADLTNSSFTINVTVLVNSDALNGSILNNTITTAFNNLSGGNLSLNVSELTTVNATAAPANLTPTTVTVSKTDSPDPVNNGSQLNYTINVTVTQGNATNVTVVDNFPSDVTFDSSSPANTSNGTWSLGNLTTGQSILINITVNVSSSASGTLTNNVNVTYQNATNDTNTVTASASTTVNTGGGSSGSSGGGGGSGGSGGTICPPLCQYPENANLPVCKNNCPQPTEMVAPPVQELPSFPTTSDSVDTSANLPESESAIPIEESAVEVVEESANDQRGLASFFPWLILLILIALVIAILSHSKKGGSKPAPIAVKTSVTKQTNRAHSKETEEILNNIRKSEERLKHLLGK